MNSTSFSCIRVKKIRTATDARNATRHGRRDRGTFGKSAVDLNRTHLNQHWRFCPDMQELELVDECPDYREALEARREQLRARRPKNGTFGTEMMFTASPALFRGSDGQVDNCQAKTWARACLDLAEERYPGMCVAARLDLDETTPHLSVFIMPVYEKNYGGAKRQSIRKPRRTVSHNKVFGGPQDLSFLQSWAADGLKAKGFDVRRGRPAAVTRAVHFRPDGAIYQHLSVIWQQVKKREEELDQRERTINAWLKNLAREIGPLEELVPNRLKVGVRYLTKYLDNKASKPSLTLDAQIEKSADGQEPVPPAPRM